jgi:NACalpha-BTF3-like transcription factor
VITVDQLNAYDVLVNDDVVFTSAALQTYVDRSSAALRPEPFDKPRTPPVEDHDDVLPQAQSASEEAQRALEEAQGALEEARGALDEAQGALEQAHGAAEEDEK